MIIENDDKMMMMMMKCVIFKFCHPLKKTKKGQKCIILEEKLFSPRERDREKIRETKRQQTAQKEISLCENK
jgi:hypothetical protein